LGLLVRILVLQTGRRCEEYIGLKIAPQSGQFGVHIMQSNEQKMQRIAFIGFGEASGTLGSDLAKACDVRAYDTTTGKFSWRELADALVAE
jgi:hypothetical protein